MPGAELIAAQLVVLLAGIISGLTGFGFALVIVAPLLLVFDPVTVVTFAVIANVVKGWIVLWGRWGAIRVRAVLLLLPGAALGSAAGVAVLQRLDAAWLKLLASVVVVAFALLLVRGWTMPGARSRLATGIVGFLSGALNASTGLAGPPVVLLFTVRDYDVLAFRVSIVAYFMVVNIIAFALFILQDVIHRNELVISLQLLPATLIGTVAGRWLVRYVSSGDFRRIVLGVLLATGMAGIVNALLALTG